MHRWDRPHHGTCKPTMSVQIIMETVRWPLRCWPITIFWIMNELHQLLRPVRYIHTHFFLLLSLSVWLLSLVWCWVYLSNLYFMCMKFIYGVWLTEKNTKSKNFLCVLESYWCLNDESNIFWFENIYWSRLGFNTVRCEYTAIVITTWYIIVKGISWKFKWKWSPINDQCEQCFKRWQQR